MRDIFVICGIDSHIDRIKRTVKNIQAVLSDPEKPVDIGIATFGSPKLRPSERLREYARGKRFLFYDAPRQKWVTLGREFHCCEVIGMLTLSKWFYEKSFDRVFLLHNDIYIDRDFRELIAEWPIRKCWSFIAPVIKTKVRDLISLDLSEADALRLHSHQLSMTTTRISQECVIFSRKFVDAMYATYGTEEKMWNDLFVYSSMFGDLGLTDIKNFLGFEVKLVKPFLEHGGKWQH